VPRTPPAKDLDQIRDEIVDLEERGLTNIELPRSKVYDDIHSEAISLLREIYKIPEDFEVLLLQGGASLQFAMVPMNLYRGGKVEFVDSGSWSSKAIKEAKIQNINFETIASSKETSYDRIPENIEFSDDLDYAYIHQTIRYMEPEYREFPETKIPSSCRCPQADILSYQGRME